MEVLLNIIEYMTEQKTREEKFTESVFEWVKTDRTGDVCKFIAFDFDANGVEYVCFEDGTRINTDLIGDIVLMHSHGSQILGAGLIPEKTDDELLGYTKEFVQKQEVVQTPNVQIETEVRTSISDTNPVLAILEKTKKKPEKLTVTLTVKIPSPDLYSVIKENFDDVDNVILQNVMAQIQDNVLRDSLRKELQNIYAKKKK